MTESKTNYFIVKWSIIGLLIRFLIMPFSFHGHDIFFIYYFPYQWLEHGHWDPYLFLKETFPPFSLNPYYPPVLFLIISLFLFIIKPFLPYLPALFSTFEKWNFSWEGNSIHFADILFPHQLYRTLFLFKLPLLFFDFGTGWLILKMLKKNSELSSEGKLAYKIWMINPFMLHSGYALGQVDVILTFFVIAAVYSFHKDRNSLAFILLSLSALIKTYTVFLIPLFILARSSQIKDWIKWSGVSAGVILACLLPFYLSSHEVLQSIFFAQKVSSKGISLRLLLFFISYFSILFLFFFSVYERFQLEQFFLISLLPYLFLFPLHMVTLRFFILMTPFLILLAVKHKLFWSYNILFFLTLFELKTGGNSQQWGLFAPLYPEFISSLPILDSFLNLKLDVVTVHRLMYRLFVLTSFFMAGHIFMWLWRKKCFQLFSGTAHVP